MYLETNCLNLGLEEDFCCAILGRTVEYFCFLFCRKVYSLLL